MRDEMMIVFANSTTVVRAEPAAARRLGAVVGLAATVLAGRMFVLTEE